MADVFWTLAERVHTLTAQGQPLAVLTVVSTQEIHSRWPGTRFCMDLKGQVWGGMLHPLTHQALMPQVQQVLRTGKARVFHWAPDPAHGSTSVDEPCTFFIESMEQLPESWRMAVEHLKHREGCIVATELDDHPRHYLLSEEDAPVRPDRRGTLLSGVFLQRLEPALRMVVSGSQDTASSLLSLARAIHLEVTSVGSTLPELDAWTALVVFPEPEHEVLQVLLKALQGEVGYIGVVCSLWHARHLKERLLQAGAPRMERVFAPAGLHLGTVSSQGMALEILAEILAVFHQQEPHSLDLKSADWMGPFR